MPQDNFIRLQIPALLQSSFQPLLHSSKMVKIAGFHSYKGEKLCLCL